MTDEQKAYDHGVRDERIRLAKRLRCGWKSFGSDGVYAVLDELEFGIHSLELDAAEQAHSPLKKSEKP